MKPNLHTWVLVASLFGFAHRSAAQDASKNELIQLENGVVRLSVSIRDGRLSGERLESVGTWATEAGGMNSAISGDGGFGIEVMYTDWQAPRKPNNAENPAVLGPDEFRFEKSESGLAADGSRSVTLLFAGKDHPIQLRMLYILDAKAFFVHRSLSVRDTSFGHHFLRAFWPIASNIQEPQQIVHRGGFGQPIALTFAKGSAFFGVEYPAAENESADFVRGKSVSLKCGHEYGALIKKEWLSSENAVLGIAPTRFVKQWFFEYLDRIRVAPLRPYALYNSWYDLRSPEYPRVPLGNVMSEQSAMKMVNLLRENMIERHGIQLDAFVLDDGWDVYKSDWELRKEQWPNGFKPLADQLAKTGTDLGIWFGPTGGYSFRKYRLDWMKQNGYETVGDQLCVGGTKYGALLNRRTGDFVQNDHVAYFKWDGIQFSCSEPDHGHAVDLYSRRSIMQSVIGLCRTVREKNPKTFLNITSGTWMSPWWVKYANTIWMQGEDYGYADIPSLSQRDGAITYRDFVLYDGLKQKDLWFPISNLMTHGIIKGKLELLGSPEEPLDKFTDDVLLYFARGVSMYELYISPDILSEGEWTSISRSMKWARDRFPLLMNTEMIGGNPTKGEPYGYAHFKGKSGILAVRNPVIDAQSINIPLVQDIGLDSTAEQLVLECVYPARWISPVTYRSGETVTLPLEGFETAVYEMYPLRTATEPLFAGAVFEVDRSKPAKDAYTFAAPTTDARLLNADRITDGARLETAFKERMSDLREDRPKDAIQLHSFRVRDDGSQTVDISATIHQSSREGEISLLVTPEAGAEEKVSFAATVTLDRANQQARTELQEGRSQWFSFRVIPGRHTASIALRKTKGNWSGKVHVQAWYVGRQTMPVKVLEVPKTDAAEDRVLPPVVFSPNEAARAVKLGEGLFEAQP